ncbi:MAG: hypothetical protein JKY15_02715 [Deltaproteobacteria bacterium]|nr:hypothetical protein [Deltaproteobacteria bacterium]
MRSPKFLFELCGTCQRFETKKQGYLVETKKREKRCKVYEVDLSCQRRLASEFIARFDELSGIEKRGFIERMVSKIIIKSDNKLEMQVLWDPKQAVTKTTKSSVSDWNGGVDGT